MQQSTSAALRTPARAGRRGSRGNGSRPRPRRTFWWYLKWFFICLQLVLFCAIIVTASVLYGIYQRLETVTPDVRKITSHNKAEATVVYAADGTKLAEFRGEQREWIALDKLNRTVTRDGQTVEEPGWLPRATIAVEDWRFYSHPGMDPIRVAKAALVNFRSGDVEQGGSTITEQLAKNVYLTHARTYSRRLQTALLALKLERTFSKDEILELYLNEIYYGNNAYGCEAASRRYFNKSAADLSISEAALLAGIPQSPTRLNPFTQFKRAKARQRVVLHAMLVREKINYTQYLDALKDDSLEKRIKKARENYEKERRTLARWRAPYFVSYVKSYLQKQYNWSDEFLSKSGLKIYTTLDPKIQSAAERAMNSRINQLDRKGDLQGALVCIDPWSGRVLAMYGGRDYYSTKLNGQFNRATQAKRQPGSTFKPFVYAAAMEAGETPNSMAKDEPLRVKGIQEVETGGHLIRNYDHRNRGSMNLRSAIGMSNNVIATRTLLKVGVDNVVGTAHRLGIKSALRPVPTLALGTSEVTVLENTSAFGVFATKGLRVEPTPVVRVENYAGEVLAEQPTPIRAARVLSQNAGEQMWEMLRYVVTSGTGRGANLRNAVAIGKTGTTSSNKDVWFMGATNQLVCGIWMGKDTPTTLRGASGSGWIVPAWKRFMENATDIRRESNPVEKTVEDARATAQNRKLAEQNRQYIQVRICSQTGLLATRHCPRTRVEEFSAAAGAPTKYCTLHTPSGQSSSSDSQSSDLFDDESSTADYNAETPRRERERVPARRDTIPPPPPGDGLDDAIITPEEEI